nr:hypothetical protein [Tanacetum cinerariifolium]
PRFEFHRTLTMAILLRFKFLNSPSKISTCSFIKFKLASTWISSKGTCSVGLVKDNKEKDKIRAKPDKIKSKREAQKRILEDKIICDLDNTPDLSQRSPQNCPKCGHSVNDSSEPSNDNINVANALREPFVGNQDPGKNSSQSPPQINHHCCYSCGDPLEGIFCHKCTWELCGNGAHYGYNCPPKVPIIPNSKSFNNQTIKELPPTMQNFDPKADLVHDSSNVFDPPPQLPFIPCEFYRNDARYGHYCTPQVLFIYQESCYNQDFNFPHDFQQQDLCCENCRVTHEAYQCQPKNEDYYHEQNSCYDSNSFGFDQFQPQQYIVNHPVFNVQNDLFDS